MTLKEMREKAGKLAKRMRELADKANGESREFNTEEAAEWKRVNEEYDALKPKIAQAQRLADVEAETRERVGDPAIGRDDYDGGEERRRTEGEGQPVPVTEDHRRLALNAWFRHQLGGELTEEQRTACNLLHFRPSVRELVIPLLRTDAHQALQRRFRSMHPSASRRDQIAVEQRTLSAFTGATGAYLTAPASLIDRLEINMLAFGGMREVSEVLTTATGEEMRWPTADDTSNTGEQLGESASIGSSVDPSFGQVIWNAYKFSSKPILVPYELLQDSMFPLDSLLGDMLGERLGRITNTKYTTGTGAATPKGIVTAASAFSAGSATAIAADDLLGLVHSINPAYRSGAAFMMHDSIVLTLRKLKDGDGEYLWQNGLMDNRPDTLLGAPISVNQDMDSTVASGKKTILYGRLSNYKIRRVGSLRLYRLQERYRDTDQDAFIAFIREDGNLLTAGTAPVKYLSH